MSYEYKLIVMVFEVRGVAMTALAYPTKTHAELARTAILEDAASELRVADIRIIRDYELTP